MSYIKKNNQNIKFRTFKNVIIYLLGIAFVLFNFKLCKRDKSLMLRLNNEGIIDTAVVAKIIVAKGPNSYQYIFNVKQKKYKGSCATHSYDFSIGDKIIIKYLQDYPNEISKPIAEGDSSVIKW